MLYKSYLVQEQLYHYYTCLLLEHVTERIFFQQHFHRSHNIDQYLYYLLYDMDILDYKKWSLSQQGFHKLCKTLFEIESHNIRVVVGDPQNSQLKA